MALTLENGTIVTGANSYVSDAEFTAYADARGFSYPSTAVLREPLLIQAIDYLESLTYKGTRTDPDNQVLAWPRYGVYANDRLIPSDEIPQGLKNAQMEAGIAAYTQSLLINENAGNVASEQLDVLSVSYFKGGKSTRVRLDRVMAYLAPYLSDNLKVTRT